MGRYLLSRIDQRGGPGVKKSEAEKPVTRKELWNKTLLWDEKEAWRRL